MEGDSEITWDSVIVLEWAKNGRYNSKHAMAMGIIMVGEMSHHQISDDPQHLSSKDNHACDSLSRLLALGQPKRVPEDEQGVLGRLEAVRVLLGEQTSPC